MQNTSYTEKNIFLLVSILLIIGLFLNLNVQPVFLEEPRRAITAMEMLESGNFIVPTFFGDIYTMKPPLFNWLIILSTSIFSDPVFALRLPTVLSTIGIALVLYFLGKRYIDERFGWILALCFVSSNGILFYFSLLGEIDLFYSFVTLLSFLSLFHFSVLKRYYLLFILTYFFGALGFLTKGIPSLAFLGISILVWFWYNKELKRLISWSHIAGISIFALIVGGYFLLYQRYNDSSQLAQGIWSQASDRTVLQKSFVDFVIHIFIFPVETLLNIFPGVLLLIFAIRSDFIIQIKKNRLITFAFILFFANFILYWASPGARQRYIYMLYPFIIMIGVWFYHQNREEDSRAYHFFRILSLGLIALLGLGSVFMNFMPELQFLPYVLPLSLVSLALMITLFYIALKNKGLSFAFLLLAVAIARIVFDLTALPQRAHNSAAQVQKEKSIQINDIVGDEELYFYKSGRISYTIVYYLNLQREKTLRRTQKLEPGAFYISKCDHMEDTTGYKIYMDFYYNEELYHLLRFETPGS